jgi:transposase-like protein
VRAVDSSGATVDFLLSAKREAAAAERFQPKALDAKNHPTSGSINTDKDAACPPGHRSLWAAAPVVAAVFRVFP